MTQLEQETEYQRRRNMPGVEVRRMYTKRTIDTILTICGREIASRHESLKRGKVVSTTFLLPAMEP